MKSPFCSHLRRFFFASVCAAAAGALLCVQVSAQNFGVNITVDGAPLIASKSAMRQGNEWLVPLVGIARALSVSLEAGNEPDTIVIRRSNGTEYSFNQRTGEIRSRYLLIGRVAPIASQFHGPDDEILFPLSGIVVLFGVTVTEDGDRNVIAIESNRSGSDVSSAGTMGERGLGRSFQLLESSYSFGFTTNGREAGQISSLKSDGLWGGGRFDGNIETSLAYGRTMPGITQASLRMDRSSGKAFLLGDQSTYSGLEALTASVRGAGYEHRPHGYSAYYYGGRSRGSTSEVLGAVGESNYDTTIGGFSLRRRNSDRELAFAGNAFRGPGRNGVTLGTAYSRSGERNQIKGQTMIGRFSGINSDGSVDGFGYGFAIADAYTPSPMVSLTAQTEHFSKNFMTARDDTRFSGQTTSAVGLSFRPKAAINLRGGITDRFRVGQAGRSYGFTYGAQYVLQRQFPVLLEYFRNISRDTALASGRFAMSQYSVNVPNMNNYSFSAAYSEIHNDKSLVRDLTVFAAKRTRWGQIGAHDHLQFGKTHRYGAEWSTDSGPRNSQLRFGAERVTSVSGIHTISPAVSVRFPFFSGQSLEVKYVREPGSFLFQLELRGPIVRRREVELSSAGQTLVVRPSDLKGRVYLDADNDGRFQDAIDRPLEGLAIWLNDTFKVITDVRGTYHFDRVPPGAHRLRVDLSGVPADLAMVGNESRTLAVTPNRENVQDFRVLRMGRIEGKVMYLDYSEDSENPIERPLPDARIVVAANRDTYTEADGIFLAGDLVPGEYKISVDPTTIPEGYMSRPESIAIVASPGQKDGSARFLLSLAPRPVIERKLPAQDVGVRK